LNKWKILPTCIILIQLVSLWHLYYTYKYGSSQIPAALIELSILAIGNILVLVAFYFFYFKTVKKQILWWTPISVAVLVLSFTLICYFMMVANRYGPILVTGNFRYRNVLHTQIG